MHRHNPIILPIILMFAATGAAFADDVNLPPESVPEAVRAKLATQYPKATIKGYVLESRSPRLIEVEMDDDGSERSVIYRPDGSVTEVETVISTSDLPAAVRVRIDQTYPEARIVAAERSVHGGVSSYEIDVSDKGGIQEVVLDATGKILSKSKPDADNAD